MIWARYPYGTRVHAVMPGEFLPACGGNGAPDPGRWAETSPPQQWAMCRLCAPVVRRDRAEGERLQGLVDGLERVVVEELVRREWPLPADLVRYLDWWVQGQAIIAARRIERSARADAPTRVGASR